AASAMPWLAPLAKGRRAAVWSLAILLALAVGVAYQWPDLSEGHLPEAEGYYLRGDPDTALILKGVGESPRLVDTLDWWTGIWCGVVPFWRPIPSLLFWAEEKVFGYDFRGWAIVHVLLAGVLAAVMFWALEPLLGIDGAGSVVFIAVCACDRQS
ncbi:MAG: hypothetical protein QGI33_05835, partial [Candidatus Brocadiia bacterium]|nr:hypothetical protein [Candidatus Brocadiia bacterium]